MQLLCSVAHLVFGPVVRLRFSALLKNLGGK